MCQKKVKITETSHTRQEKLYSLYKKSLEVTKQITTTIQSKQQNNPWWREAIWFPELPHYNTQIVQVLPQITKKNGKKQESIVHSQEKWTQIVQEKLTQIVQEEEKALDSLAKDFKLTI